MYFFVAILLFAGTEFKNIACCKIGCLLALEIQRGKEGMRMQRHWVPLLLVPCD